MLILVARLVLIAGLPEQPFELAAAQLVVGGVQRHGLIASAIRRQQMHADALRCGAGQLQRPLLRVGHDPQGIDIADHRPLVDFPRHVAPGRAATVGAVVRVALVVVGLLNGAVERSGFIQISMRALNASLLVTTGVDPLGTQ